LRFFVVSLLLVSLLSCSQWGSAPAPSPVSDPAARLQAMPAASPEKYRNLKNVGDWKNPTLIVREDGIGLLDLANHEIHILKPEDVPAALANLPSSAWPYGRIVLVQFNAAASATEEGKIRRRENRALLIGTLDNLKVAINEIPSS